MEKETPQPNKKDICVSPAAYSMLPHNRLQPSLEAIINRPFKPSKEILHMHASRCGPLVANEFYISRKEKERNPELQTIYGVFQPFGTTARFLNYWFAGLPQKTCEQILYALRFKKRPIFKEQVLDANFLTSLAGEVTGEWAELCAALFSPIFNRYKTDLLRGGFTQNNLVALLELHTGKTVTLETAMLEISKTVINTVLANAHLPVINLYTLGATHQNLMQKKHINHASYQQAFFIGLERIQRRYENAYMELARKIKSYNGKFPPESKFATIYARLRQKSNRACSKVSISYADVKAKLENSHISRPQLPFNEYITSAIKAFMVCMQPSQTAPDDIPYFVGEGMIEACFEIAMRNNICLVLQRLMRGSDYRKYEELLNKYPRLDAAVSAGCTWNISEFPEFDFNFVRGIKYVVS